MLGLLNKKGKEISEFKYSFITPDESGDCWALHGNPNSTMGMNLVMLKDGKEEKDTGIRLLALGKEPYQGLLSARNTAGLYGYINLNGEMAIEAKYQYTGDFVNGCAVVVENDQFGIIDISGSLIVKNEFDFIDISEYGYIIAAQSGEKVAVFDMQGNLLDEYFGENISIALVGRYYTVCDEVSLRIYSDNHRLLYEKPPYSAVYQGVGDQLIFSDGVFGENCVRILGTQNVYQNVYPLGMINGEAVYGYISVNAVKSENHTLNEIQYSLDMSTLRYGAINSKGEILLDSRYLSLELLDEDRLLVQTEDEWQMIDILGNVYWSMDIKTEASGE